MPKKQILKSPGIIHIEAMGKPPGCKLIRVSADIENSRIKTISIRGDFFANPEEAFERAQDRLIGTALSGAGENFGLFLREEGVETLGISGAALGEILTRAGQNL
ncbi:MAG: hypothetical protein LBQ44_02790 [Treponema sp.]|jgi:hypothetical protein|nr:hypothetical protein [Treponema sp.]